MGISILFKEDLPVGELITTHHNSRIVTPVLGQTDGLMLSSQKICVGSVGEAEDTYQWDVLATRACVRDTLCEAGLVGEGHWSGSPSWMLAQVGTHM